MLRHKAMIQCARVAFGYGGIFDQDEAERIVEATDPAASPKVSRNPQAAATQNRPEGYEAFEAEHIGAMREAAMNGQDALTAAFQALPKGACKNAFWQTHQAELKASASSATVIDQETGEVQQ